MADRSVITRLTANVRGFVRGMDRAADKTQSARREVSALETRLTKLATKSAEPKVNLDSDEARDRLTWVRTQLTELGATTAEAKARVDDADSQAKLSRIEAQLLRVGSATADPEIDLDGVAAAEAQLAALQGQLNRYDGSSHTARVRLFGTDHASRNMSNLIGLGLAFGPAFVPVAAAASAAMFGFASAAGAAATGAGTVALAAAGVGDALKELNEASLDPTEANLENLQQAMEGLSVSGQQFVRFLFSLKPQLQELRAVAQSGLFPGVQAGISELLTLMPQFERLVNNSALALGELAREGGQALTSPFWRNFISFISAEAGPTLQTFGRILGNTAEGFAGMMMAFNPMAQDLGQGLEELTRRFSQWGRTLGSSEGFQSFVNYVRQVSPQVLDTFSSIVSAIGELAQAAAPIGPVVLDAIEGIADTLATIASIPGLGTGLIAAATGLGALNTAIRAVEAFKALRIVQVLQGYSRSGRRGARGLRTASRALRGFGLAAGAAVVGVQLLRPELDGYTRSVENAGGANLSTRDKIFQLRQELRKQRSIVDDAFVMVGNWGAAWNRSGLELNTAARKSDQLRGRIKTLQGRLQQGQGATDRYAGATDRAGRELEQATSAAQRYRTALSNLITGVLRVDEAEVAYLQAKRAANKATEKGSNVTLQERSALLQATKSSATHVQAIIKETGNTRKAAGAARQHRSDLVDAAVQMGYSREEAQKLINKYIDIPNKIRTFFNVDDKNARKKVGAFADFTDEKLSAMADRIGNIEFTAGMGGMKAGGPVNGPGTETSDSIPARLSAGEHVWTAREVRSAGGHHAVEGLRQRAVRGFAQGGPVDMDDFERVNIELRGDISKLKAGFGRFLESSFGGGRGLTFARAQAGEPYVWGGTGPTGWDCSGFMGGIMAAIQGGDPYRRYFSTHSFAGGRGASGFKRGLQSPFMIGVDPGSHMAGTIGGVNMESSGSAGVRVGGGARGARHPMFDYRFGLAGAGGRASDRALANEGILADRGTVLPHGLSLVRNATGGDEHAAVFTNEQWRSLRAIAQTASGPASHPRGDMRVTGGQLDISRNSRGELEAFVRDVTVQEIGDDASFRSRVGA